jgi:cation diffusion facilitator CzcD-associated flavoprotein CzcO
MAYVDVDVLIIGAGLSGIGAAYHLQKRRLGKTFRYPGVRSDSDLYTFGYDFKSAIGKCRRRVFNGEKPYNNPLMYTFCTF